MLQTKDHKIRRAFSISAKSYDHFSGLHQDIADQLLARVLKEPEPSVLLDVGCGTGYLTVKAKESFPSCRVIGLDFAPGMIEAARSKHDGIAWVLADGSHLPFSDGNFDILISNLAYQWAVDLTKAFRQARRVLTSHGSMICTLFGYNTCRELFQSLEEAKTGTLQFARLPDEAQVREALTCSGFKDINLDTQQIKIEFKGMIALITWLRSIGANNLSREGYLGPETISRAAAIYRERFPYLEGIGATFEVIRIYGKK